MTVKGHVDGVVQERVVGWAVSEASTESCRITVIDAGGASVAEGCACLERPDLSALNLGRTNVAFAIAGINFARPGPLRVLANGIEILNSPILIGPGNFDGRGVAGPGAVIGWVTERTQPALPILVQVFDQDDHLAAETIVRAPSYGGTTVEGQFEAILDQSCFGRDEIYLSLFANGVLFANACCSLPLVGKLEIISATHCSGWLLCSTVPHKNLNINVFVDGTLAGVAKCTVPRPDVSALHPGCLAPGFAFRLPDMKTAAFRTISLQLTGASMELFEGPYLVGDQTGAILAARRLAQLGRQEGLALSRAEASILQQSMADFIKRQRLSSHYIATRQVALVPNATGPRLTILMPVYRGTEITRTCIQSVLDHGLGHHDQLLLINDCSPETGMGPMLSFFSGRANIRIINNEENLGFVRTVNRGLSLCLTGDVLLLNADTVIAEGALDELLHVAYSAPDIGTVTALSNNATIFSYPHPSLRLDRLADFDWAQLASVALHENHGLALDVPTGHGFCMLIKREVLDRVGHFDEAYGRGYGEENDFCSRAADLGYRNVAAPGVLVEHRESISFTSDKQALLAVNLARLEKSYPEYTQIIMAAEAAEVLRRGRWALDTARLRAATGHGQRFVLVVRHGLGGGTAKAIDHIEAGIGYGGAAPLYLEPRANGLIALSGDDPLLLAVFADGELDELFNLLATMAVTLVLVHQVLGFSAVFITRFAAWCRAQNSIFYGHDFYALCPRVVMINALGEFCDAAPADICARCIGIGGTHASSRLDTLEPIAHRALFADALAAFRYVVVPSDSAASYLRRMFPAVTVTVLPNPDSSAPFPRDPRSGNDTEIVLFGALGAHKGSATLLEIARRAKLTHPHVNFRVIGMTDIDEALQAVGNVVITGRYEPYELVGLCAQTKGRLALFLSPWPETYSYTLSEAVQAGFIPLVPDLGAPAERVHAAGYGVVFGFPIVPAHVLQLIDDIAAGRVTPWRPGAGPASFQPDSQGTLTRLGRLFEMADTAPDDVSEWLLDLRGPV